MDLTGFGPVTDNYLSSYHPGDSDPTHAIQITGDWAVERNIGHRELFYVRPRLTGKFYDNGTFQEVNDSTDITNCTGWRRNNTDPRVNGVPALTSMAVEVQGLNTVQMTWEVELAGLLPTDVKIITAELDWSVINTVFWGGLSDLQLQIIGSDVSGDVIYDTKNGDPTSATTGTLTCYGPGFYPSRLDRPRVEFQIVGQNLNASDQSIYISSLRVMFEW